MSFKEATEKLKQLNNLKEFRDKLRNFVISAPGLFARNGEIDLYAYKEYREQVRKTIENFYSDYSKKKTSDYKKSGADFSQSDVFWHKIAGVNINAGNDQITRNLGKELFDFKFEPGTQNAAKEIERFKNLASRVVNLLTGVFQTTNKPKTNVFDYFKARQVFEK